MDVIKYTRPRRLGDLVLFELDNAYTRDSVTVLGGSGSTRSIPQFAVAGAQVEITSRTATAAAKSGNTGNGVMGAVTVAVGAQPGAYKVVFIEPGANVGTFVVYKPDGTVDGEGAVAAAYAGSIGFTLADGATDFISGDAFTITVNEATVTKYTQINFSGADGTQNAAGIFPLAFSAPDGVDVDGEIIARGPAVVRAEELAWPAGATADQIAFATDQLKRLGILVRTSG